MQNVVIGRSAEDVEDFAIWKDVSNVSTTWISFDGTPLFTLTSQQDCSASWKQQKIHPANLPGPTQG
jgi:hypothetical protein